MGSENQALKHTHKQANKTEKVPVKDEEEGSSNGSREIQTEIQLWKLWTKIGEENLGRQNAGAQFWKHCGHSGGECSSLSYPCEESCKDGSINTLGELR